MAEHTVKERPRSMVLWFPDWPITAQARAHAAAAGCEDKTGSGQSSTVSAARGSLPEGDPRAMGSLLSEGAPIPVSDSTPAGGSGSEGDTAPVAIVDRGEVVACSAAARAVGVRRGQRRRDAQARCPRLSVIAADQARDQRMFAPVVSAIEERAPGVQIIRPGLCALSARGPARYYEGEENAAIELRNALFAQGLTDVRVGIADGIFTAEQAARAGTTTVEPVRVVLTSESANFLAPLPITALAEAGGDLIDLFARLGIHTLGQVAGMDSEKIRDRLGERGVRLRQLCGGEDPRGIIPRVPPLELHREVAFEPPLESAEQVAFGVRMAADEFIAGLTAARLVCIELRVELIGEDEDRRNGGEGRSSGSDRVWLHPDYFDAAAVVDRGRWQLAEAQAPQSGVALVRITPEKVEDAAHHAPAIFGAGTDERVHHALSRVQAMLGHRGVVTATVGGGRWLHEREVLVPWGDRPVISANPVHPWPGALPQPLPSTTFWPPPRVDVRDGQGMQVEVEDRGGLSADPESMIEAGRSRSIVAWAGPWPVIERGWDAARARRAYRFQVIDDTEAAWLLVYEAGTWTAEGQYD